MYHDVHELKEYYETFQGRVVQRLVRQSLRKIWPEVKGLRVLGLGYALPFLRSFFGEAERVAALMPARQGVVFWPPDGKGLTALCDEGEWPVETNSVDRLLVMHFLENTDRLEEALKEAWRVMSGGGRVLLVVPNRAGLWAKSDRTPFGHGTPYTVMQIHKILRQNLFVPERSERALFFPPSRSRLLLLLAPAIERFGARFFHVFGGLNVIEASKQLYAPTMASGMQARAKAQRVVIAPEISSRS